MPELGPYGSMRGEVRENLPYRDSKHRWKRYQRLVHLAGSLNPVEHISRHERFAFHRPFEGFRHGGIEAGDEAFDPLLKMFL